MIHSTNTNKFGYGQADTSYKTAGELEGIRKLVDAFYGYMESLSEAAEIRAMHKSDLRESRDKLTCFLSGWMGGPKLYAERYGSINIPGAHRHLHASPSHRDAWLLCMQHALNDQNYPKEFKAYIHEQLRFPAQRIVEVGES